MDWHAKIDAADGPGPGSAAGGAGEAVSECDRGRFREARERLYRRLFGPPSAVLEGGASRVDVFVHPPGFGDRDFFTLVTSGMSDRPMAIPPDVAGAAEVARRAELVLYTDVPPGPVPVGYLRVLAQLPRQSGAWLAHGHTLPNGDPPQPLFPSSRLTTALVVDAVLTPECLLRDLLVLDGDAVAMLWPVPITPEETAYKLRHGTRALLDAFNEAQLSCVTDWGRASVSSALGPAPAPPPPPPGPAGGA